MKKVLILALMLTSIFIVGCASNPTPNITNSPYPSYYDKITQETTDFEFINYNDLKTTNNLNTATRIMGAYVWQIPEFDRIRNLYTRVNNKIIVYERNK